MKNTMYRQAALQQQPYCLVKNGVLCPCSQSSGAWLQAAPRGAYTTARTVGDGTLVLKLSSHVQRLAQSANLMAQADAQLVTNEGAPPPAFTAQQLRPRVLSCLSSVVEAFHTGACKGGVACLPDPPAGGNGTGGTGNGNGSGGEPSAGSAGTDAGVGEEDLARQLRRKQLKLTMLMTWGESGGYDVWCHGEALPDRPRPPVKLQFRGLPRTNARAKDSEWVRKRRALEESKPQDVNEVILSTPDGDLLEGLSSNFFALQDGAVVTAEEGVLGGTIREIVLQVCGELGVPLVLEPPKMSDIERWQGAFISSTSRLLLPADELRWALPGHGGPGGTERVRVFPEQHPLVRRLEAAVMARILQESEQLPAAPAGTEAAAVAVPLSK